MTIRNLRQGHIMTEFGWAHMSFPLVCKYEYKYCKYFLEIWSVCLQSASVLSRWSGDKPTISVSAVSWKHDGSSIHCHIC